MFLKGHIKILFSIFFAVILIPGSPGLCAYVKSMALGSNPKYSDEFDYFEYTDPNAEVGGELRMASMGTFDKVNPFSLRGIVAAGVSDLIFEPLQSSVWTSR